MVLRRSSKLVASHPQKCSMATTVWLIFMPSTAGNRFIHTKNPQTRARTFSGRGVGVNLMWAAYFQFAAITGFKAV